MSGEHYSWGPTVTQSRRAPSDHGVLTKDPTWKVLPTGLDTPFPETGVGTSDSPRGSTGVVSSGRRTVDVPHWGMSAKRSDLLGTERPLDHRRPEEVSRYLGLLGGKLETGTGRVTGK